MALLDAVTVTVAPQLYYMEICWRVRFTASDTDAFEEALALVKCLPPSLRTYDPEGKAWRVRESGMAWLAEQWPALREAWMRARSGEARGWRGTDERAGGATSRDVTPRDVLQAFAQLYLLPSAPAEVVQAAWRALARRSHPDVAGGDGERMRVLNAAYERSREWARDRNGDSGSAA